MSVEHPTETSGPLTLDELLHSEPLPMVRRSLDAFRRELPALLKQHDGEWVAYHGDERVGFGRTESELYEKCFRRGLSREEFVVCGIEPEAARIDEEIETSLDV